MCTPSYHGILFSLEREGASDTGYSVMNLDGMILSKASQIHTASVSFPVGVIKIP